MQFLDHKFVLSLLPDRPIDSHKGNFGKVLLICGSRGYTGAAALAAMGALRTGAGLVYLAVPQSIYEIEAIKLLEPIVIPLPDDSGMLSTNATAPLSGLLDGKDAVLLGPGLGRSEGVRIVTKFILENFNRPIVLDADGINSVCKHKDILRERTATTILTPHEAEFARLKGSPCRNRIDDAVQMAQDLGCIILLKGHNTVITDGVHTFVNTTGNPGMAVGGSGDVLAGMIVSFLGQGIPPLEATACAAWIHGAAGDLCAAEIGQYGMLPSDLLQSLPRLLK